jgi:hypothetical protein
MFSSLGVAPESGNRRTAAPNLVAVLTKIVTSRAAAGSLQRGFFWHVISLHRYKPDEASPLAGARSLDESQALSRVPTIR